MIIQWVHVLTCKKTIVLKKDLSYLLVRLASFTIPPDSCSFDKSSKHWNLSCNVEHICIWIRIYMHTFIHIYRERNCRLHLSRSISGWYSRNCSVTVHVCRALFDSKTPIVFLSSFRLNTALHYALLIRLSLSTWYWEILCTIAWDVLTLSNTGFFRLSLHGGGGGEWSRPVTLELLIRLKHNLAH